MPTLPYIQLMTLRPVTLDDKYDVLDGRIFLTGVQALVRLPLDQRRRDLAAGLNTAGFISGYRGSPLGTFDDALWRAKGLLKQNDITFVPGVNEELAATSVWGSQQAGLFPSPQRDGVFGMWYGKGPGVDRASDALKHGNFAGTSPHGGVLVIAGDDHGAKSSTTAHQSEQALMGAMIPILNPASVQDCLDFGLYGWAMSRLSGLWVSLKSLTDVIESGSTIEVGASRLNMILPPVEAPPSGMHIRFELRPFHEEGIVLNYRLPAAQAFVRANGLDRVIFDSPRRELSIVTTGKSYADTRQALAELGLDEARCAALGVRILKLALTWPIEPEVLKAFAAGSRELFVIEEKRPFIQDQISSLLFNLAASARPALSGKADPDGRPLLPSDGELSPAKVAEAIAARLEALGLADDALRGRRALLSEAVSQIPVPLDLARTPAFCSGCPHNTSTKLPEGSMALAGIGCHTLAHNLPDRPTGPPTQMGGEGANWIGAAPFSGTKHVFQNLGDGTYFHSGLMAIRSAVAARVNITYKILFNDAVAMTGGQPFDGPLSVPDIVRQVSAEGITRIAVVSDEPEKYGPRGFGDVATVHHRDDLIAVEKELREVPGASVLIYDQTCAAEKRRRRKKGQFPDPQKRMFINDLVCEGCGDCSVQSNCVSIQPLETELGRKRIIDQSSCNKDYSCNKGFCPSFITVKGGKPRRAAGVDGPALDAALAGAPEPTPPALTEPYSILVTGIGGTGVVTIGAVLGMAAHLEGRAASLLDVAGLSQKNGAVYSHVKLAQSPDQLHVARIGMEETDLLLGCDLVVSGSGESLRSLETGRSHAVVNTHVIPTALFQQLPDMDFQTGRFIRQIRKRVGEDNTLMLDATVMATRFAGDSIATNMFLVGFAWQSGLIPLSREAIEKAIALNGVAVGMNTRAFNFGRLAAHDRAAAEALIGQAGHEPEPVKSLTEVRQDRADFLVRYQNRAYAARYLAFVDKVAAAENARAPGQEALAGAVARYLFKLMAYKDEYEVARLHSDGYLRSKLAEAFEGPFTIEYNLAPPGIARTDKVTGHPRKMSFGAWMTPVFGVLARFKGLRSTPLDVFGYTAERRMERRLIEDYRTTVEGLLDGLSPENHDLAVQIASVPEHIRGYGHVKDRHLAEAKAMEAELLARWRAPAAIAA